MERISNIRPNYFIITGFDYIRELIIAPIKHLHTNKTKLLSVKKYHKDFQHTRVDLMAETVN